MHLKIEIEGALYGGTKPVTYLHSEGKVQKLSRMNPIKEEAKTLFEVLATIIFQAQSKDHHL